MSDTPFEWNDQNVMEFVAFTLNNSPNFQGRYTDMEQFKAKKRPKPKEPEQREWDIMSFRSTKDRGACSRWIIRNDGEYIHDQNPTLSFSLQEMLERGLWSVKGGKLFIESVRRKSDNEIFTIGDKLKHPNGFTRDSTIAKFEIEGDLCYALGDNEEWSSNILHAKKVPNPIFTSSDGVDIHKGMQYWTVNKRFQSSWSGEAECGSGQNPEYKYFSTEAAAEKYVFENKPIYSVKDFRELIRAFEERIATKTDNHV